jgi:hypothetical protein
VGGFGIYEIYKYARDDAEPHQQEIISTFQDIEKRRCYECDDKVRQPVRRCTEGHSLGPSANGEYFGA